MYSVGGGEEDHVFYLVIVVPSPPEATSGAIKECSGGGKWILNCLTMRKCKNMLNLHF